LPPKVDGICDKCGGKLIQRDDDKEDVVRNRLNIYHKLTSPLLDYYKNKGILFEVDATQKLENTVSEIIKIEKNNG
jgi:adenylate kinase